MRLDGRWTMLDVDPGEGERLGLSAVDVVDETWVPAQVPGDVHTALLAAGRIPDPFFDRNVEQVQWVEDREWWFRTVFAARTERAGPHSRDVLTFDGLDTFATVYLNGHPLGAHRNMFRPAEFDVTGSVLPGARNAVAVRFDPVRARVAERRSVDGDWGSYSGDERREVRKNQSHFSWDWAPRLINVGIWRGVRLERFEGARLRSVYLRTLQADATLAVVSIEAETEQWDASADLQVDVRLARDAEIVTGHATVSDGVARIVLTVQRPQLWWPHDLGTPALYDVNVVLRRGDTVMDETHERIGLRTIELDRTPNAVEAGTERFTFVVNGVPIFAKGANWIPADSLNGRVGPQRYAELLHLFVEANGNMLRVWGGGQYEQDAFYRLADELGVLVWQDFMFACATYPDDDPAFVSEVRAEAEYQIRRLRNRASVAVWVGNNEIDWLDDRRCRKNAGRDYRGKTLFHTVLPEIARRLDPSRPYWPSSPYGGDDHNSAEVGDRHNWQVWHGNIEPHRFGEEAERDWTPQGVSYRHFAHDTSRFVSEFGMHAAPVLETLRRNVPAGELTFGSDALLFRNKDVPPNKGDMLMRAHTGLPGDIESYVDYSMICQAEGLKFAIEHYRRRKPWCSGTLFWQWNDCWPGLSWSVLDYYTFPKAGYFFVRRAYSPILASLREEDSGSVSVWLINDTLEPVHESLIWTHARFDGQVLAQGRIDGHVERNRSECVGAVELAEPRRAGRPDEYLWLHGEHGHVLDNRLFFAEVKDLVRSRPNVTVRWEQEQDGLTAHVSTDGYAYFVRLFVPVEGIRYSDNWFDLRPGQERLVHVWHPDGTRLDPAAIEIGWR